MIFLRNISYILLEDFYILGNKHAIYGGTYTLPYISSPGVTQGLQKPNVCSRVQEIIIHIETPTRVGRRLSFFREFILYLMFWDLNVVCGSIN